MDGDTSDANSGSDSTSGSRYRESESRERAGRLTTTIPRPTHRTAAAAGRSRLASWSRGGDRPDRLSPSRRTAWLFGLAAIVIAGAIGAALFVLPVRAWFSQDDRLRSLEHQLGEMQRVNSDLQAEVDRLQTDDGVREAARDELGQIEMGDQRQTVADLPPLPRTMPAGWPYSQVDQILNLRTASGELAQDPDPDAAAPEGESSGVDGRTDDNAGSIGETGQ